MTAILRTLGAVVAALATIFVLLIAVELYSSVVHPTPTDFDGSMEQMCQHVASYPNWVLASVVPMWGFIALLGTWIAGRVGNRGSALFVALLILAAVVWNVAMLPYPLWFKIVQPLAVLLAVGYGVFASARRPSEMTSSAGTPAGTSPGS